MELLLQLFIFLLKCQTWFWSGLWFYLSLHKVEINRNTFNTRKKHKFKRVENSMRQLSQLQQTNGRFRKKKRGEHQWKATEDVYCRGSEWAWPKCVAFSWRLVWRLKAIKTLQVLEKPLHLPQLPKLSWGLFPKKGKFYLSGFICMAG